ncbi:MAG: hypothetical protein EAZ31_05375 [Cytophagia bacterium]|nr:MAG: hypothetical protein EAZ31_05375 [Cytophagia bacterium]
MKKLYFLVCILFLFTEIKAQTIIGKVQNIDNQAIKLANILIKENNEISEFTMARNGEYKIILQKNYTKLVVEVNANGYEILTQTIDNIEKDKIYTFDFILQKQEEVVNLEEVTIKAPPKPIEVQDDTTKYNVKSFTDGTERKIIDVIKKLPGVEVNEKSGEIKFKGKSIETVALEGDNLFGNNYTMGTKNINVDMVEQVQAIENYTENPLLKGIENSDKVILNLKLKKQKFDFSGEINSGLGGFADKRLAYHTNNTILGITTNYKSFGVVTANNIGANYSSMDYFGNNQSVAQIKEASLYANKILPEMIFSSGVDDKRSNINQSLMTSFNNLFKIKKSTTIKVNFEYAKDNIFAYQRSENQNFINNQNFTTSDNRTFYKTPTYYRAELEMKHHTSKTSLLEYELKIQKENINTNTEVLQNNVLNFNNTLQTNNFYLKQKVLLTKKITSNKALQFNLLHSSNEIPQNFTIFPSVFDNNNFSKDIQRANIIKNYVEFSTSLLGNYKGKKYTMILKGFYDKNLLNTNLFSSNDNQSSIQNIAQNNTNFTQKSILNSSSYYFHVGKRFKITTAYSLSYLSQSLNEKESFSQQKDFFIFEPNISVKYSLTELSSLIYRVSYTQNSIISDYLLTKNILTSNRNARINMPELNLQKSFNQMLYYGFNDLSNQFRTSFSVIYKENEGNFFSNANIQPNFTQTIYFFLPEKVRSISFNFNIQKYIDALQSNLELKSNYSISNYKNIVNNSQIRDNQNDNFQIDFDFGTALDYRVNFYNSFHFAQNISKNSVSGIFRNSFLNNSLKIVYSASENLILSLKNDYFVPTLQKSTQKYLFMDFDARWKLKKGEINFTFANLLNNDNFTQIETSDYSINIFQSRLLPRYFLIGGNYNF